MSKEFIRNAVNIDEIFYITDKIVALQVIYQFFH